MKTGIFIFILIISNLSYGQNNAQKYMELKALGRDSLINMAIDQIINDSSFEGFNQENYDSIKVYIEGDDLYVVFSMSVLFSPINSSYIYSITVHLTDGSKSWSPLTNPKDKKGKNPRIFYIPEQEQKKALKFIYKSGKAPVNTEVTIFDHPEYYEVEEMSISNASFYKINKEDGKIFDEIYEELAIEEEENSGITEIKE